MAAFLPVGTFPAGNLIGHGQKLSTMSSGLPYRDNDDDVITPDATPRKDQPVDPARAVHAEEEKYGETSADENRADQWDEHHGEPDDIV